MKSLWALCVGTGCIAIVLFAMPGFGKLGSHKDRGDQFVPELFGPGVISTTDDELSGSFSPDGHSFYFVRRSPYTTRPPISIICVSHFRNRRWTSAEVVPFSGTYQDTSPFVAPDGRRLYFASRRPLLPTQNAGDWNLFYVDKIDTDWSAPKALGGPVNTSSNEVTPAVAADGTIYFASDRDGPPGYSHLFRATWRDGCYTDLQKLDPEVNGGIADYSPYITPNNQVLVFASLGRKDALIAAGNPYPRTDLYVSVRRNGRWSPARHLEHDINTFATESNPTMSPDGQWLYFTSERSIFNVPTTHRLTTAEWEENLHSIDNGVGNIYRISSKVLEVE